MLRHRHFPLSRAALCAALLACAALSAQDRTPIRYERPPPPPKKHEIMIGARYMVSPDVSFGGLGNVPFATLTETENDFISGTERAIFYDDGIIRQDFSIGQIIGGDGSSQLIPNLDGASSSFTYFSADQVVDNQTLAFRRYAASSTSLEATYAGGASGSLGWEIQYRRFIDRSPRFAIMVGVAFNGFDSSLNQTVEADLEVREFLHRIREGNVPPLPDPTLNDEGEVIAQPPYIGFRIRPTENPVLIEFDPITGVPTEYVVEGGAEVRSTLDFRSSIVGFRAGPTYDLSLGRNFNVNVGAGLSASVYSAKFSVFETLILEDVRVDPTGGRVITNDYDFILGGYFDAGASYRVSERMRFFSGVQVHGATDDYVQRNEERRAEVRFDSQIYVNAGIGIRF